MYEVVYDDTSDLRETTKFKTFGAALTKADVIRKLPRFRSVRIYRMGCRALLAQAYKGDGELR